MRCPNCKYDYQEGYTVCSECGAKLVESEDNPAIKKDNWSFGIGKMDLREGIEILFYFSLLISGVYSFMLGKYLYVYNIPLSIFGGIICFIALIVISKIICELLYIIFHAIETYTNTH